VITTNSGYPLDMNLYQCGKGMSAAEQIVRPGGAIIMAAECCEGIPDHGLFGEMLRAARTPQELFDNVMKLGEPRQDQWAAQIQARIQIKADVYLYSHSFTDAQIREALLIPCRDIPATVEMLRRQYGAAARICVVPEGPQTIPYYVPQSEAVSL
jgi:nickel-dependent lactate racemase